MRHFVLADPLLVNTHPMDASMNYHTKKFLVIIDNVISTQDRTRNLEQLLGVNFVLIFVCQVSPSLKEMRQKSAASLLKTRVIFGAKMMMLRF